VDRVLITGAAGTIGRILRRGLHGRVGALRLLDVAPLGAPQPGEQLVTADIRDLEAVTEAMDDVDATVHLGGIPHEDSFDRILETNVVGTYNIYEAARRQGCPRVVFASSLHVTGFYDASERISPEMPVRPDSELLPRVVD
jgi:uronate dehydrogenase